MSGECDICGNHPIDGCECYKCNWIELSARLVFEEMIGEEKASKCALWAFGDGFEDYLQCVLPELWNEKHPDLKPLHVKGDIYQDIGYIIGEWESYLAQITEPNLSLEREVE